VDEKMAWNFVIYCVTAAAIFCQKNPEIQQAIPQNYAEEMACVDAAIAAAQKYKFDNPDAEFKYSCALTEPIIFSYQPERIAPSGYRHW
jgi:hypothetical protein